MIETANVVHGFERVRDVSLHHLGFGGQGRPIVLLHGVTGSAWDWNDVARSISSLGSVVALDLRGHGDSMWSTSAEYGTGTHIADLAARVEAMRAGEVDLVGYSWGALISIGFAARHPERVRRLVIVDVEPSFVQAETDIPAMVGKYDSPEEVFSALRASNPHGPEDLLRVLAHSSHRPGAAGTLVPKHDPYFLERWPFRSDDRWSELESLTMPTLVVHAEASFVSCDVMREMANRIPRSALVHLPDTTHVVPVDNPSGLVQHLAAFLGSQEPSDRTDAGFST